MIALQLFGRSLGGPEAPRWVAILQALLAGWVVYVAAAGMLFEGIVVMRIRRTIPLDLPIAMIALAAYLYSAGSVVFVPIRGHLAYQPLLFHWVVILLAAWTGLRWWQWSRRIRRNNSTADSISRAFF